MAHFALEPHLRDESACLRNRHAEFIDTLGFRRGALESIEPNAGVRLTGGDVGGGERGGGWTLTGVRWAGVRVTGVRLTGASLHSPAHEHDSPPSRRAMKI